VLPYSAIKRIMGLRTARMMSAFIGRYEMEVRSQRFTFTYASMRRKVVEIRATLQWGGGGIRGYSQLDSGLGSLGFNIIGC
jgi:hypothetical protein